MNNVSLMGRLTRDPELRYTPSGAAVVRFTLAINRRLSKEKRAEAERANQPTADFISCTAWNRTAETIANYVKKGDRLAVTGRIQTGRYESEGKTVYTTDVVVENMDFVETAGESGQVQQMRRPETPVNSAYSNDFHSEQSGGFGNTFGSNSDDDEGFYHINNEDIPF